MAKVIVRLIDRFLLICLLSLFAIFLTMITCFEILGISGNWATDTLFVLYLFFLLVGGMIVFGVLFVDIGFRICGKTIDWDGLIKKPNGG